MPAKSTATRRRRTAETKKDPLEIVVKRGATRRFDALKTQTSELPVIVTWDRREADRRASTTRSHQMDVPRDRRASDRRQKPPFTWDLADFVVVAPVRGQKTARKRKTTKA